MKKIETYLFLLLATITLWSCHSRDLYDPNFGKTDNEVKPEANTSIFQQRNPSISLLTILTVELVLCFSVSMTSIL